MAPPASRAAAPPNTASSRVALFQFWYVAPLNQNSDTVFQAPVPPLPRQRHWHPTSTRPHAQTATTPMREPLRRHCAGDMSMSSQFSPAGPHTIIASACPPAVSLQVSIPLPNQPAVLPDVGRIGDRPPSSRAYLRVHVALESFVVIVCPKSCAARVDAQLKCAIAELGKANGHKLQIGHFSISC